MNLPHAIVTKITSHQDTWGLVATCPEGRTVHHGGGDTSQDVAIALSSRISHCMGQPATRKRPACSHGDYTLVPAPGLVLPSPKAPRR